MPHWAVIITGGSPLATGVAAHLPTERFVIAADSGLDHAIAAGIVPDLVVGDLDSVSAAGVAWARERAIPFDVYPTDKDLTDTQIALGAAWARQLHHVLLVGGGGDRLDHSISALTALGHPSLGDCRAVRAIWGTAMVHVLHAPGYWEPDIAIGQTFSLLALHGECSRVTLAGAQWPLADADIEPGSSLGVSNVATDTVRLSVGSGVLTLVVPYFLQPAPGAIT
ncbi:MAG: thiN [Ilumatobacteraceae bacterium]|nr:thiN [Ilumatobacteraceae bacterium]